MWILIIFIVILIVVVSSFGDAQKEELAYMNESLLQEIVDKLNIIQDFTISPYWDTESGLVMLIPVNANGEMYSVDSDRIQISILLYETDLEAIRFNTRTEGILNQFKLVNNSGSFQYKANTTGTFSCDYKTIMEIVYQKVRFEFPNVKFEFDGSRVLTNKMNR